MLLTPEIISILTLDFIFLAFGLIAFLISLKIYLKWNIDSTRPEQYKLEKQSHLVATIIKYIFILKLPLFLFFVFTSDKLSHVIPGAMCAAGVVDSVNFSTEMFFFKILNLYIFGFWLVLHSYDIKNEKLPFTRYKFLLYCIGFILLVIEIFYEISFFTSLDISKIVSCCGTIFSTASTSGLAFIFQIDNRYYVIAFYLSLSVVFLFYWLKNDLLFLISNFIYLILSIISLIMFFGTYIYQLPTHHCPFCMLQKDYYYVGYGLYISLYIGTFYGISGAIMGLILKKQQKRYYNISITFNIIYALIVSAYVMVYFIKNGVWL
ncbi:hypothetical protein [Sulfurospirillum sp. 1612]|uniref:hypothetical protein n=1 Tax=Sulfurospirillum sp. 1612 TaxID=3094835 RepID=UPI002F929076